MNIQNNSLKAVIDWVPKIPSIQALRKKKCLTTTFAMKKYSKDASPIPSMYGIFTYIWLFLMVKYGKCR